MKILICLVLMFLTLFTASCAAPDKEISTPAPQEIEEEPSSVEPSQDEKIFVYNSNKKNEPNLVVLTLNAEPTLLGEKYARLAGVVGGQNKQALLEVAGRGLGVKVGDQIIGYTVLEIGESSLKLGRDEG
ncbi:MAG: hypothetical protein KJ811_03500 [Candidatus Margulisbacteria bacterium]|nr:hypothetical protein [Candidatus Margulisiibacteriota bacterium]